MSLTVLAMGLAIAFIAVIWAALVVWGLVCPSDGLETEPRIQPRQPLSPERSPRPHVHRAARLSSLQGEPLVSTERDTREPGKVLSGESGSNVVDLAEWREDRKRRSEPSAPVA